MIKKNILSMLIIVLLSSCYVTQVKVTKEINNVRPVGNPDFERLHKFYLFGTFPRVVEYNATDICKDLGGIAFVEVKLSALNTLIEMATLGIYSPAQSYYYCQNNQIIDQKNI